MPSNPTHRASDFDDFHRPKALRILDRALLWQADLRDLGPLT